MTSTRQVSTPLTIGVEEEFFLIDVQGRLVNASPLLLPDGNTEHLQQELFECIVETTTPIVRHPLDVLSSLAGARRRLAGSCERHGLRPLAVGSYPGTVTITPRVTSTTYYRGVAKRLGDSLAEQLVCGLHIHVGFPSTGRTLNALEGMIPWLASLLALGANSPFEEGRVSSLRSVRAWRLGKLADVPLPPATSAGAESDSAISEHAREWWDVRQNTRHGTLEIRVVDQPTDVRRSASFAAIVHALATMVDRTENANADRAAYLIARDAALAGTRLRGALAEYVEPVARQIGTWPMIACVLDAEPEAGRQLRLAGERGVAAVLDDIAERTVRHSLP